MIPRDMVQFLSRQINRNIQKYLHFFSVGSKSNNDCMRHMSVLYESLDSDQQKSFVEFMHTLQSETLGAVFALLDNQDTVDGQTHNLELQHGDDKINGDLSEILFELEQECE